MLSPIDLIKGFFTFKSYFTWFLMASTIFGIFFFFKRKLSVNQNHNTTIWKGYLTYFLIIIGIFSLIYLCFFHKPKEPSSKAGQLVQEIDKTIDKYEEKINNYEGLKDNWEQELTKIEAELKELQKAQKLTQEQKTKIEEVLNKNEDKIKEIKEQLKITSGNITILKGHLQQKEAELANKEKYIKQTEKQISESIDSAEKEKLRTKLDILCSERLELIGQILHIKSEIEGLESKYRMYTEQLQEAERFKKKLMESRDELSKELEQLSTIIITYDEKKSEIQNNINEIKEKQAAIEAERKSLEIMKQAALAAKSAADDYERKNHLNISSVESFIGNVIGEALQFKKIVYVWEEGKNLVNQLRGAETKEQKQERKQKEHDELLAKQLGTARMLFLNPDGTMKMINQSTFDLIKHDLDKQIAKLDADYKDFEKKLEEYNPNNDEEKMKLELGKKKDNLKTENIKITEKWKNWIVEYTKIIDELIQNRKQIQDINKLERNQNDLKVDKLQPLNEEIEAIREELKNKSPNYTRTQNKIKQKRYNKFLQPIAN